MCVSTTDLVTSSHHARTHTHTPQNTLPQSLPPSQAKAEALSSLDARLQEESRAREAAQTRLTAFEKKAAELQASVKQLGVERREVERQYDAKLSSERNLRLQEQVEWQRRIDKVRTDV